MQHTISKSQYVKGLQCPKALWLSHNRKDLAPDITAETQAMFDTGNEIGQLAMRCFENGVEVTNDYWDIEGAIAATQGYIETGHEIVFEATAMHPQDGTYCRIDVLRRVPDSDEWDLIEVKSATSVKPYHLDDMSFQYHVFANAGYKVRKCFMMVIDNGYVRSDELKPQKLFRLQHITDEALARQSELEVAAVKLIKLVGQQAEPVVQIGTHCKKPFECEFMDHCWRDVPAYSIFNIYNAKKSVEIAQKINSYDLADIPDNLLPAGVKQIDIACYLQNKTYRDRDAIKDLVAQLQYPVYYLDYETLSPAIPLFEGTSPYEQVPFQFSLHVEAHPGGDLQHHEFIHKDASDPRRVMSKALIDLCGNHGSVIVYNASFEKGRNNELAEAFPEFADDLLAINERMIDLLVPFKKRWLYHPAQKSSASIKAVLPAFTDISYEQLGITNGAEASMLYQQFAKGNISKEDVEHLWYDLSKYCEMDTLAMVRLMAVLRGTAEV